METLQNMPIWTRIFIYSVNLPDFLSYGNILLKEDLFL